MPAARQRKPSGQRALNKWSRHCSSVPNRAMNVGRSRGRSFGSILTPHRIACTHHTQQQLLLTISLTVVES